MQLFPKLHSYSCDYIYLVCAFQYLHTCIINGNFDIVDMYILGDVTFVAISVQDYPPGDYNLTIIATDIFNQTVNEDVSFVLSGMSIEPYHG